MSRGRVLFLVVCVLILAVVAAAVLPLPRGVTRTLAAASSQWLVTGPLDQDGRATAVSKRLLGAYVQMSLAAQIADSLGSEAKSDEERLLRIMLHVRNKVLSQAQYDHIPRRRPVLIAGLGYSHQINGAVAMIAARDFEKAQVYALYDPATKNSPHTVGRVWSSQHNDWLYFDAFFDQPVIYTRRADGKARFHPIPPQTHIARRGAPVLAHYNHGGRVIGEMKSNFGAYIANRVLPSEAAEMGGVSIIPNPPVPQPQKIDDAVFERVSRAFVLARVDDLLGAPPVAAYRRIANDPAAVADDRAAEIAAVAGRMATEAIP